MLVTKLMVDERSGQMFDANAWFHEKVLCLALAGDVLDKSRCCVGMRKLFIHGNATLMWIDLHEHFEMLLNAAAPGCSCALAIMIFPLFIPLLSVKPSSSFP